MSLSALVLASAARAEAPALRPEVGKPLQEAQEDIKAKKFADANSRIDAAEKAGGLTPFEKYTIARMRASAALGAGDNLKAAQAFEAVLASGQSPAADQGKIETTVVQLYYRAQSYPKAIEALQRYKADGGSDPQILSLYPQALYLEGKYAEAATEIRTQIAATEKEGAAPGEPQLQLLASCALKQNDTAGYVAALQKLVTYAPKKSYWADLIARVQGKGGFSDRYSLDADRLRLATDNLDSAQDYVEAVQLAIQAGQPAEAQAMLNRGFAKGVLGSGPEAERHQRLKALVDKQAGDDKAGLAQSPAAAAALPYGDALINTGLDFVAGGQAERGAELIDQGAKKGNFKRSDEALLHAGYGYYTAGKSDKATQTFKLVQGGDGAADLAGLWEILARHHQGASD
ncbi:MAG: hypothetical protein JOY51_08645 [Nevskia sp.]|nr:hypothetical protein [Nevskia sp.]